MRQETRNCQSCKRVFIIETRDFEFYEKIKVPAPTWCPECRMIRRLLFRNQRTLYRRKVVGSEKEVFSVFPSSASFPVYFQKNWFDSDNDPTEEGRDYDFEKPFFTQLKELMQSVPWQHAYNQNAQSSEYCSNAMDLKSCYLMFNSGFSENCMYGSDVLRSRDSLDMTDVLDCESSYELLHSEKCNRCFFSNDCVECLNVWFSSNLVNCHDCVGCVGLRNKQFCIFNQQYSKEDYFNELKRFDFSSFKVVEELKARIHLEKLSHPVKFMHGYQNINSTGDYLENSKNTQVSFMSRELQNCAHCQMILFVQGSDMYDATVAGGERCYEISIGGGYNIFFSWLVGAGAGHTDVYYSMNCFNSSYLFGCVGLRNKKYCILNRQYRQEEYEALMPKIMQRMNEMPYQDGVGRTYSFGEFFPFDFSPYPYNETIAHEFFPLTKEEALQRGYRWQDPDSHPEEITLNVEAIPDDLQDTSEAIMAEIIECGHKQKCNQQCTGRFKIIPQELEFYKKMNLALPRLCHNCRHYERIAQRNPLRLWKRTCLCAGDKSESGKYQNQTKHFHGLDHCSNTFETSYAPDRPEIVYCKECYQAEVA